MIDPAYYTVAHGDGLHRGHAVRQVTFPRDAYDGPSQRELLYRDTLQRIVALAGVALEGRRKLPDKKGAANYTKAT